MLDAWFNRKRKKSGTSELDLRSQRSSAGKVRRQGLDEVLFLAPLPDSNLTATPVCSF